MNMYMYMHVGTVPNEHVHVHVHVPNEPTFSATLSDLYPPTTRDSYMHKVIGNNQRFYLKPLWPII